MQAHKQPQNQLEVLTNEVQEIFDLINEVPYDVIFKTIVLDRLGVESGLVSDEKKGLEDSIKCASILNKITKFNERVVEAYKISPETTVPKVKSIDADYLLFMLAEVISRVPGLNPEKLNTIINFCEKLHKDLEVMQLKNLQMYAFATFYSAIKRLSQQLKESNKDKSSSVQTEMVEVVNNFLTLSAQPKEKEIPTIKDEDVNALFKVKGVNIYNAIVYSDIKKVIEILALLAKYPELVVIAKADIASKIAKDPSTTAFDQSNDLITDIEKLNDAYLHDPLLMKGINIFFDLQEFIRKQQSGESACVSTNPEPNEVAEVSIQGSSEALGDLEALNRQEFQRRSQELSQSSDASEDDDQEAVVRPDSPHYRLISDKIFEWIRSKGVETLEESEDQELQLLQRIITEIRMDSAEFQNPIHKLQVVGFAAELQEKLFLYAEKIGNKNDNDLTTLKKSFKLARTNVNDLLKYPEASKLNDAIHALFKMIDDMINNKSFSKFLEKKSGYAFYKTKTKVLSEFDELEKKVNGSEMSSKIQKT